ncbi:MAG: hypothetical protein EOP50_18110 [Sphingobacteriales bacterium]|nr:MAG: hypothetical protein EOP50_18110 [Sphingobacteriales bacterium]
MNDNIKVTSILTRSRKDGSRWSIRHELIRGDGVKAAVIVVDGAWMDVVQRKLTRLPEDLSVVFMSLPKSEDYTEDVKE